MAKRPTELAKSLEMIDRLAVIVGIANYASPRLHLRTPVKDAQSLNDVLSKQHGYKVILRTDREASLLGLVELFETTLPTQVTNESHLLVYVACHGVAINSLEHPRGYLVPWDGNDAVESLFSMERLYLALNALPCKHLLLVLDCCFAGAFRWSSCRDVIVDHSPKMFQERYKWFLQTPAWQVITSAAYDEKALDIVSGMAVGQREPPTGSEHSPFFVALRNGIQGDADIRTKSSVLVGDGVITATDLYLYLRDQLETAQGGQQQTPGLLHLPRHRKGEYIFHVPHTTDVSEPVHYVAETLPSAAKISRETSPYRGFEVYELEHARNFFGRAKAVADLIACVERQLVTIVVGNSGAGKSSLVRAGLIPALRKRHPGWQVLDPIRPGLEPLASLTEAVKQIKMVGDAVVIIDQLEEVLALPEKISERREFFEMIDRLENKFGVRIVGTLGADRETELWTSPLGPRWRSIRYPLPEMTREELREAIEGPAERMVLVFDPPEMVNRLVDTVVAMPGGLPLLSFTLDKLYRECVARGRDDRRLVEESSLDVGGISLALREHADALYDWLDPDTQQTMRRVLLRMITIKGDNAIRRQVALDELEFRDAKENARVQEVLRALTGGAQELGEGSTLNMTMGLRLAVLGGDRRTPRFVELAHDVVVRDWPQLNAWRVAAEDDLDIHRAVTDAAREWKRFGKKANMLWSGERLARACKRLLVTRTGEGWESDLDPVADQLNLVEYEFLLRSRRRHRSVRVGIVAIIAAFVAILYISIRRMNASQLRDVDSALLEQGARIEAEATVPGKELAALIDSASALSRGVRSGRRLPSNVRRGATLAAAYQHVELTIPTGEIGSFACSRDGRHVAIGATDGSVFLYGDSQRVSLPSAPGAVRALALSADSSFIVTADNGEISMRTLTGMANTRVLASRATEISVLSLSPDEHWVASGAVDGLVGLCAIGLPRLELCFLLGPAAFSDAVTDLVFSRDGKYLAAASNDGTARIWSLAAPDHPLYFIRPETNRGRVLGITSVDFTPDSRSLVTAGIRTSMWNLSSRDKVALPDVHALFVRHSASGREMLTVAQDGSIERWDSATLRRLDVPTKGNRPFDTMVICGADGIGFAESDARLYIHTLHRDNATTVIAGRNDPVVAVMFDPDDRTVVAESRRLDRWNAKTGTAVSTDLGRHGVLWPFSLFADSATLPIDGHAGENMRWDTVTHPASRSPEPSLFNGDRILAALVATRTGLRAVDRYRAPASSRHHPHSASEALETSVVLDLGAPRGASSMIAFAPREDSLAAVRPDGMVEVLDVQTGARRAQMFGHVGAARAVAYSRDGEMIATAGDDGTARLWDAGTGEALAVFTGHRGPVLAVSFSHDGRWLATGGRDGTVRIYPIDAQNLLDLICSRLRGTYAWGDVARQCGDH